MKEFLMPDFPPSLRHYSLELNTVAYDTFSATIRNTSGAVLAAVGNWSNINQDGGPGNPYYRQKTFNLLPYAGQTIRIYFSSVNDSSKVTNFRVDDVSVSVTGPTVTVPTVQTVAATSITATSAQIKGTITSDGGSAIIERRFDWGTSAGNLDQWTANVTVSGNNFSYNLSGLTPDTTYYFRAWAKNGSAVNVGYGAGWNIGTILNFRTSTAQTAPSITTQPVNRTVAAGNPATFTVAASGNPTPSFQWQRSTDSGATWNNLNNDGTHSGVTTATLTVNNTTTGMSGYRFRAIASNGVTPNATSSAATLTVNSGQTAPSITTQPVNRSVTAGQSATFTVAASGNPTPGYQWQRSIDNGVTWNNLSNDGTHSGVTTATLTVNNTTTAMSGYRFRVIASNGVNPNATSSAATLTVNSATAVPITQDFIPAGRNNRPGYPMTVNYITIHDTDNSNVGANALMHANYVKNPDQSVSMPNNPDQPKSWHFTVDDREIYQHLPLDENGWHAGDGLNGIGNRQSIGIEICMNSDGNRGQAEENAAWLAAKLLTDLNLSLDRVMQHNNWSGKNCPSVLRGRAGGWDGFLTRVAYFKGGGPTTAPSITTQPVNRTVTAGNPASFTVAASGNPTPSFQWQRSTDSGSTWNNLSNDGTHSGVTTATLTVNNTTTAMSGYRFRAIASNGVTPNATSSAATLTVNPAQTAPLITTQPVNQTVTAGNSATFTVAANGSPTPSFQWQRSTDSGATWNNLSNDGTYSGVTTATLTVNNTTTGMSGYRFRAVASNGVNPNATSTSATLTVDPGQTTPSITTPLPGSTLTSSSVTFQWISGTSVTEYFFYVGTSFGTNDLYGESQGLNLSVPVNGLPMNGSTLYVRLWWQTAGVWQYSDYTYVAATVPPPSNDAFANRIAISSSGGTVTGSNFNATKETGEPGHAGNAGGRSVWWTWTAPANGTASVDTIGSSFDTLLAIYTGNGLNNLTPVAADDDGGGGLTSRTNFNAVAGATYQIAVDGYAGGSGSVVLRLAMVVPNTPPRFTGIGGGRLQPPINGQFQIEVHADQQQVTIQASDDLTNWTDVGTVNMVNGQAVFTDTNAGAHTKRFYRPKP